MNFAFLGTGHGTFPLIRALVAAKEHRLVAFAGDDSIAAAVLAIAPAARRLSALNDVLSVSDLDAAIIDTGDAEALEVAKQLASNSVAILLIPCAAHGIEFIYQLGLIRDEQPDQFRLYPIRPWRSHPLVLELRQDLDHHRLGKIHQLQFEREISVASDPGQPILLNKSQIDEALLIDADLLKLLAGEFDQVTALQMGDSEAGFVQASVTMTGVEALATQWACRGTDGPTGWRLTVTGAAGNIVLEGEADVYSITRRSVISGAAAESQVDFDYGPVVLNEFLTGLTSVDSGRWADDLNRVFDLLEGKQRSLRRKRTVELYFDTPSERSNFKTQMTAIGCGVLLLTLVTILMGLGAGLISSELKLPPIFMQVVRVLVFAPLFIFLALQVGIVLSKPSAKV